MVAMIQLRRALKPRPAKPLRIYRFGQLALDPEQEKALLDGTLYKVRAGRWMFYLPQLQAKLIHARDENIDCTSPARPPADVLEQTGTDLGRYVSDEWRRALTTPITRRLAELWIVSARLWRAGLGPQPLGLCFVEQFQRDGEMLGPTCGFLTENITRLRPKLACRLEHIEAAGVRPDKIMSCVRQQMRGYVVDLCSVVGCVPKNAEEEITRLEALFSECDSDDTLTQQLNLTLTQD